MSNRLVCTSMPCAKALRLALLGLVLGARVAIAQDDASESALIVALRQEARAYEQGNAVERDSARAAALYCQAARLGDAASQFDLGSMYAYGRGIERDDALAAFFFRIAADQGIEQASNMLRVVGEPPPGVPECMRAPVAPAPAAAPPRQMLARNAPPPPQAPGTIVDLVTLLAPEYRVPTPLVWAIMEAESNFNVAAVSPKNAQGLMQLIPETAHRFKVKNAFDPAQNVRGGMAYLRWLLAYFEGDVALVAAAYNAGERAVERYGGVPPYLETRAYVRRIVAKAGPIVAAFDASVVEPSPYMAQMRGRQRFFFK
jgi:soluble lytic murein transglycosylase-like protein